jgi:hypothetical protein
LFILDLNRDTPPLPLNEPFFFMPATEKAKAKRSYHTGYPREEHMQAAKCDVQQREIPIHAAARLHQVRLGPNHIHCKLTSFKSLGSLWDIVGSPAWMHAQEGGEQGSADPF